MTASAAETHGSSAAGRFFAMVDFPPKKLPWDRRLTERLARQSWDAANKGLHRNPSFWAQMRSPYTWYGCLALIAAGVIHLATSHGWPQAIAAILYIASLLASVLARRDARANELRRSTTDAS